MIGTQAKSALHWVEQLRGLGAPMDAIEIPVPAGAGEEAFVARGTTLLEAAVAALHREPVGLMPPPLRTDGGRLWDAWCAYPPWSVLTSLGQLATRKLDSVTAIGNSLESYSRLLDQLRSWDEHSAPELRAWCCEIIDAWPIAAAVAGRQLKLVSDISDLRELARAPHQVSVRWLFRRHQHPRQVWCVLPPLDEVRRNRREAGDQGTWICGMLAAHGCTPRPDHTTLVLLPRSVARAATMLGASVAGTCKQMDPEMAETAITLFESGMEASAALKAAQLLGV